MGRYKATVRKAATAKRNIVDVRTAVAAHRTKILKLQQNLALKKRALNQRLQARKSQLSAARANKRMKLSTDDECNIHNSDNSTNAWGSMDCDAEKDNGVVARSRRHFLGQEGASNTILEDR